MNTCPHLRQARAPNKTNVYREECTRCFEEDGSPEGLYVCLTCFNGGCIKNNHGEQHYRHSNHALALHVKTRAVPQRSTPETQEISKLAVGVPGGASTVTPQIEYDRQVWCLACKAPQSSPELDRIVDGVMTSPSINFRGDDLTWELRIEPCEHTLTLEQDPNAPVLAAKKLAKCQSCDISQNLWLCLSCGALGCSRKNYGDPSGGNEHAIAHYKQTKHPLVCKMGTIAADGTADLYCYACDESVADPELARHMSHFGINIATQEKTAKSTAEMNLELNKNFDYSSAKAADGTPKELLYGPGCTGLVNLGNTCYMASVFQILFSFPSFAAKYTVQDKNHVNECRSIPADCWKCQMVKLADGLLSGQYSTPPTAAASVASAQVTPRSKMDVDEPDEKRVPSASQTGIAPRMIARLVTRDHAEFRTKKQQDAVEFLQFFLDQIKQQERNDDPTTIFEFRQEERLECLECHRVRYQTPKSSLISIPVVVSKDKQVTVSQLPQGAANVATPDPQKPLTEQEIQRQKQREQDAKARAAFAEEKKTQASFNDCLNAWAEPSTVDYACPICKKHTKAQTTSRFSSFPETLIVQMRRFVYDEWVPRKVGIDVIVPDEPLDLAGFKGKGLQPSEQEFPISSTSSKPQANEAMVAQVAAMGFSLEAATRAVLAVKNAGVDEACSWLFSHLEDPDINALLPSDQPSSNAFNYSPAILEQLLSMGFPEDRCKWAMRSASSQENALDWLMSHMDEEVPSQSASAAPAAFESKEEDMRPPSYKLCGFITHLGPSVQVGHYIAHVWKENKWVSFNDEKVFVDSEASMHQKQAYLYLFRRVG